MILSLFLRHYKVYQGAHYIRVRVGDAENNVSIYLGDNAVGKSSILEALDTYFNGSEWTRTIGSKQIEAFIAPFLAVNKKKMEIFLM